MIDECGVAFHRSWASSGEVVAGLFVCGSGAVEGADRNCFAIVVFEVNGIDGMNFEGVFGACIGDDSVVDGAIVEWDGVRGFREEVDGGCAIESDGFAGDGVSKILRQLGEEDRDVQGGAECFEDLWRETGEFEEEEFFGKYEVFCKE